MTYHFGIELSSGILKRIFFAKTFINALLISYAMLEIRTAKPQILEIMDLEASTNSSKVQGIRDIVESTLERATARYGLQVLSKYGIGEDTLIYLSIKFDERVTTIRAKEPHECKDFPYIEFFVAKTTGNGYKIIDVQ